MNQENDESCNTSVVWKRPMSSGNAAFNSHCKNVKRQRCSKNTNDDDEMHVDFSISDATAMTVVVVHHESTATTTTTTTANSASTKKDDEFMINPQDYYEDKWDWQRQHCFAS